MAELRILIAASEAVPYAKTGGLADVAGALHGALRARGVQSRLIMPLYKSVREGFELRDTGVQFSVPMGASAHIAARLYQDGDATYFIRADELFDRDGLYGDMHGEFMDNDRRFIFFSRAVLEASRALGFVPHVVHCNDWHTGLAPAMLKYQFNDVFPQASSLISIHNIGYQGLFTPGAMPITGFGPDWFHLGAFEFYGKLNMLKSGVVFADAIGTVSPTYAREIMTAEFGWGLEGVVKSRQSDLHGIINGIDYEAYNPATDTAIPDNFGPADMGGKRKCKKALAKLCGFQSPEPPILCIVSRLSYQKGIDIYLEAASELMERGVNLAVLGSGEGHLEDGLRGYAQKYPGRFFFKSGYDEGLSRLFYAGSDMIAIPSRYEPCGLTQMIAMRYGTVPVARNTGGLADTIEDFDPLPNSGTGFLFEEFGAKALELAVTRALCLYADPKRWEAMLARCMARDFSWDASASRYIELYDELRRRHEA